MTEPNLNEQGYDEQLHLEPWQRYWWFSFADDKVPPGEGFRGCTCIQAFDLVAAIEKCKARGSWVYDVPVLITPGSRVLDMHATRADGYMLNREQADAALHDHAMMEGA